MMAREEPEVRGTNKELSGISSKSKSSILTGSVMIELVHSYSMDKKLH